jgi:hypothetical protein
MAESTIVCPDERCGRIMGKSSSQDAPDATATMTVYECAACGRRSMLVTQGERGTSPAADTWVDRELREKGYFFPSDFSGPDRFGR